MRILILTYGSRGDVQPFVALGTGLSAAGHDVTLATSVRFRSFVESHGLTYGYMNDDLLSLVDSDEGKDLLDRGGNLVGMVRGSLRVAKRAMPANRSLLRDSWRAARETDPEIIVFHPKCAAAPHIAEKLGIGCVLATPLPMLVPTGDWRFPVFPPLGLGRGYNRATYRFIRRLTNISLKSNINGFRLELGLAPLKHYDSLTMPDGRPIPILHAHSAAVLPRPNDWPDHAHVTGYWFLDDGAGFEPPEKLHTFLETGPPPVYIGFGSMTGRHPDRLARIVLDALAETGLRGILATGWGGLKTAALPEQVIAIDEAPHDWLFPRVAAVVHHGGAGSTAAGLRAGRPSVLVPFFADQPFWGDVVHALGAGPKPIPQKRLDAPRLADALRAATGDRRMIDTAGEIGCKLRSEDGVANAVTLVERYSMDSSSRSLPNETGLNGTCSGY